MYNWKDFIHTQTNGNPVAMPMSHARSNKKSMFNIPSNRQINNFTLIATCKFCQKNPKGYDSQTPLLKLLDGYYESNDSKEFRRIKLLLWSYGISGKDNMYNCLKNFLEANKQIQVERVRPYGRKNSVMLRFLESYYDAFSHFLETSLPKTVQNDTQFSLTESKANGVTESEAATVTESEANDVTDFTLFYPNDDSEYEANDVTDFTLFGTNDDFESEANASIRSWLESDFSF